MRTPAESRPLQQELGGQVQRHSARARWTRPFLTSPVALVSLVIFAGTIILAIGAPVLAPYDPLADEVTNRLAGPSLSHPFGTDPLGRDVLSRMIYGARVSIIVAVSAVAVSSTVGVGIGVVSGYLGGIIDNVLMRVIDSIISFPSIILALVFVTAFGATLRSVIIALAVVSVPIFARLMRAQVLATKESDYVLAARSAGAGPVRIIGSHILPNSMAPIIVAATLGMSFAILAEASLSFLGAGVQPPTPTWGGMLNEASRYIYTKPFMTVFPGSAIFVLILSLNFLGDTLQDALDPRFK